MKSDELSDEVWAQLIKLIEEYGDDAEEQDKASGKRYSFTTPSGLHFIVEGAYKLGLSLARPEALRVEQPGQHLATDLHEALRIMKRLAEIISATPREAFKDWALGHEIPYDMVRVAEAFIAKPRSIFAPSPHASVPQLGVTFCDCCDWEEECGEAGECLRAMKVKP